ncbi:MAG: metal ABC transporter substrate-binding protein [Spirochaetes bacterium]|nr:metal ABC transporter substrate-binding protein [Spirochaetota bacterium]
MKIKIKLAAVFLTAILTLAACGRGGAGQAQFDAEAEGLRIVTTIFPSFDFVRQIGGDRVQVVMLLSPGAESHSFEPTPMDMITLSNADFFLYLGGDGETWVPPVLASVFAAQGHQALAMSLVDLVYEIDEVPAHGHGHGHDGHDHSTDEHVWTSPQRAILLVEALADVLSQLDPANAYFFQANAAAYIGELQLLDQEFISIVAAAGRNEMVFADRFPFRHFAIDYGLDYFAALDGCSVETQVDPATVASLIQLVREHDIPAIFYRELSGREIANVIAEDTGVAMVELHSAHNLSPADFAAGVTFLDIMWRNTERLREALWQ